MKTKSCERSLAISVFVIPDNRMTDRSHLHTDLILSSGFNRDLQKRVFLILLHDFIIRDGLLALLLVLRDIDDIVFILCQIVNQTSFLLFQSSVHNGIVFSERDVFIPVHPEHAVDFDVFGKHENPGGFLVNAVQDIRTIRCSLHPQIVAGIRIRTQTLLI